MPLALDVARPRCPRLGGSDARGRPPADALDFHGHVGAQPPRPWSVSALETYLGLSVQVLRAARAAARGGARRRRGDGSAAAGTVRARGVRERSSTRGRPQDGARSRPPILTTARDDVRRGRRRALERLPDAEAGLERTRLLGSSAAAGLGEAVLRMEAERPVAVVERLLEHRLEGDVHDRPPARARAIDVAARQGRSRSICSRTARSG